MHTVKNKTELAEVILKDVDDVQRSICHTKYDCQHCNFYWPNYKEQFYECAFTKIKKNVTMMEDL